MTNTIFFDIETIDNPKAEMVGLGLYVDNTINGPLQEDPEDRKLTLWIHPKGFYPVLSKELKTKFKEGTLDNELLVDLGHKFQKDVKTLQNNHSHPHTSEWLKTQKGFPNAITQEPSGWTMWNMIAWHGVPIKEAVKKIKEFFEKHKDAKLASDFSAFDGRGLSNWMIENGLWSLTAPWTSETQKTTPEGRRYHECGYSHVLCTDSWQSGLFGSASDNDSLLKLYRRSELKTQKAKNWEGKEYEKVVAVLHPKTDQWIDIADGDHDPGNDAKSIAIKHVMMSLGRDRMVLVHRDELDMFSTNKKVYKTML